MVVRWKEVSQPLYANFRVMRTALHAEVIEISVGTIEDFVVGIVQPITRMIFAGYRK